MERCGGLGRSFKEFRCLRGYYGVRSFKKELGGLFIVGREGRAWG